MGNSFVLFDVSIVISHGQFHCGNRGHTQNADFPWVKSHFPVGKRSSGTTANTKYRCELTPWGISSMRRGVISSGKMRQLVDRWIAITW